jgi:hypothetical protein
MTTITDLPASSAAEKERTGIQDTDAEYLQFQIEKTYASLIEAGKSLRAAFLLTLTVFIVTAALLFGTSRTGDVTMPLLGITLDRIHAARVSLLLLSVAVFNVFFEHGSEKLLSWKLQTLVNERYGPRPWIWYAYFPSIYSSAEAVGYVSPSARVVRWASPAAVIACWISVPILALQMLKLGGWSFSGWIVTFLALVPITLAAIVANAFASADQQKAIRRVEE